MSQSVDGVEGARRAVERHAWREAFELLREADRGSPLEPADLEAFGAAAWWLGDLATAIQARERAYAGYRKGGDPISAARVALDLCTDYGMRGDASMHAGWYRRAERLLEGQPESPEHGYLERRRAGMAFHQGDLDTASRHARVCAEIGERLGDANLQALGLHLQGMALVQQGAVEEGLAALEEAIVAAVSGELEPGPTGVIYCNAIDVCRQLADYQRAGEWTEAAKRWCERMAVSGFPGICRVRRAEITRLRGGMAEAEQEARRAVDELSGWYVEVASEGLNEIGEIRLRLGDLDAAEEAFRQAHEMGHDAQPGYAMLQLRRGDVPSAHAAIRRALGEAGPDPLARARLLPAAVEIAIADGDLEGARAAADALEEITRTYTSAALRAAACVARGRILLAAEETEAAIPQLRDGRRLWAEVDAPYEMAEARRLLGLAYRESGDEEAARLELEVALAGFDAIGAAPDAARAAEELGGSSRRGTPERSVRTFMFTDIVGSTQLIEAIGDEAWSDVQRWHDETLRLCFTQHGGEEVDHAGDGFFVAFRDTEEAIECAVAIQRRLAEHRRTSGFAPRVRVGLHTAEASAKAGEYRGRGVHTAARIGALAGAEEIVISATSLVDRVRFPARERRVASLKGIEEPVEVAILEWRP